ncbi:MAG: DUF3179 domain-containing protein, partial [Bacteroidia bacterium]|nr:DUF3179 domain-containing protein [Bacteroidia bacterium]
MKKIFFLSIFLLILFEFAKVYFIMPMPGSQKMNSLNLAYSLHSYRWFIRGILIILILWTIGSAWKSNKGWLVFSLMILGISGVAFNGPLTAAVIFKPIKRKVFAAEDANKIKPEKLVIGIEIKGESKAYPIEMIGYHHRIMDTVGGEPVFVTYCTVCRSGRVFNPVVDGELMEFKLVGMDHFNAMFEDLKTGSWWRQESGVACAGELKGLAMTEIAATQTSLKNWLEIHPDSKILQWDPDFAEKYAAMGKYDKGLGKSELTKTDFGSWNEKSWVLGLASGNTSHVYDWNWIKEKGFFVDSIEGKTIVIFGNSDGLSFSAWYVPLPFD